MIVAMLALFVALTGTAVATTSALITGRQIKDGSITGLDVKNKSLTAEDIRGQLRGLRGLRGAKGDKGDPGAAGAPGTAGAQGPAGPSEAYFAPYGGLIALGVFPTDTTLRSLTLPAGEYAVQGYALIINNHATNPGNVRCSLLLPAGASGYDTSIFQPLAPQTGGIYGGALYRMVVPVDGTVVLTSPGAVEVACNKQSSGESVSGYGHITAIRSGDVPTP
jgi:hypothetical protein